MKIAVTGCNGSVGRCVVACALDRGHEVVGIDWNDPGPQSVRADCPNFKHIKADLTDYNLALQSLKGCDAVVHLAAYPNPTDYIAKTHNNNVIISWNVLRSAAELGITRIVQASTVNVIALVYSAGPKFHYFPIDEDHPCEPDEPYGLSKQIAELQADSIVRRFPSMRIASLRIHWSIPDRRARIITPEMAARAKNDLWGWVHEASAADAFLLALTDESGRWSGHERFFISAPDTRYDGDTADLISRFWPDVPIKAGKEFRGNTTLFDCSKAERLLGWKHKTPAE